MLLVLLSPSEKDIGAMSKKQPRTTHTQLTKSREKDKGACSRGRNVTERSDKKVLGNQNR
jgi:hypothetical protein